MTQFTKADMLEFWRARVEEYPFFAKAPVGQPSPPTVTGTGRYGHFMVVPVDGTAWWAFEHEAARDRFVLKYPQAEAVEHGPEGAV